jgi:DNA replication and repair protein RecF
MKKPLITRLKLSGFRNYSSLQARFHKRHVVLCGANGSGKTNALEALSLLSPGRGLRRASYDTLLKKNGDTSTTGWHVHVTLKDETGFESALGTGFQPSMPGRKIRIDQEMAGRSEDLLDHARLIWLTPAMDGLFTGPKADRRRFFDRCVLATHPEHGRHVTLYDKAMRQRARLLQDYSGPSSWADGCEAEMAFHGAQIITARARHLALLQEELNCLRQEDIPFPQAEIKLAYNGLTFSQGIVADKDDGQEHLRQLFHGARARDARAGRTLAGPHRYDLEVFYTDKAIAAALASTGEQKALLISLVLAQANAVAGNSQIAPTLLLDEIAAHLDHHRRIALFSLLDRCAAQTFSTGTERSLFEHLEVDAELFQVQPDQNWQSL